VEQSLPPIGGEREKKVAVATRENCVCSDSRLYTVDMWYIHSQAFIMVVCVAEESPRLPKKALNSAPCWSQGGRAGQAAICNTSGVWFESWVPSHALYMCSWFNIDLLYA